MKFSVSSSSGMILLVHFFIIKNYLRMCYKYYVLCYCLTPQYSSGTQNKDLKTSTFICKGIIINWEINHDVQSHFDSGDLLLPLLKII